ncbi:MAG TPA: ATP-dependent DNA helicase, partial [Candidatus Eremiobacteraceae bacterium]|nr:ATP-dependent DNA helicase [Candidatus Eremiobacteraceae bacterium]
GAGTGKTFTIVERVAQLNADKKNGCPASSILLLTFSKKAAAELRSRIIERLGPGIEPPECSTFHAFALSLLKEHGFELSLSPDAALINEIDAKVEFWKAFDELIRGSIGADAAAFPLRFGVIDPVRKSLFAICDGLRDRGESIAFFRERALAVVDAFAVSGIRVIDELDGSKRIAEISDKDFDREMKEERARIEAAAALFERYEQRLREREALTYSDLLNMAIGIVRSRPEVVRSLRGRFAHCIVDEYQDTDPRQIRLIEAIFGEGCDQVMVVGDPRQTIYGFRGIDPRNLGLFGAKTACVPYELKENRRSRQEILDLAHSVISRHFTKDERPLEATRGSADEPIVHVRSHWDQDGEPCPDAARTRELEAQWVAGKIASLLSSGRQIDIAGEPGESEPIAPRHIAILSRRKTKLQPLIDALNAAGIRFRQYGGAGFYEAPEVRDAIAWLRLVSDPLDDVAAARALASSTIGLSDASIATLCRGMRDEGSHIASRAALGDIPAEFDDDARERLERYRRTIDALDQFGGAPLVVAWEATLDRAGLLLAADVRSGHRHDQARANIEKLSAMVRAFAERNPGARPLDFERYLRELNDAEADDQEADPPSADAVSVMTIHAAKGLEWPIVFVIDVWPPPPPVYIPVALDRSSGALIVTEGPDGEKPFHTSFINEEAKAAGSASDKKTRDGQRDLEDNRLFYVALTRARDELFVTGGRAKPSGPNPDGRIHGFLAHVINWIHERKWKTIDEPAEELRAPALRVEAASVAPLPLTDFVRSRQSKIDIGVPVLSFSSISQFEQCPRSVTYRLAYGLPGLGRDTRAATESGDASPNGPRSRDSLLSAGAYGNLVHRALELWGRTPGRTPADYVAGAVRDLGLKPSKGERANAVASVGAVIATLSGWKPLLVEAPFTLDIGDVQVTGFIDLVAVDPKGRNVIVDYKTGVTEKEHYALQLALYRIAVGKAYRIDIAASAIARLDAGGVTFEFVEMPDEAAVRKHVEAV